MGKWSGSFQPVWVGLQFDGLTDRTKWIRPKGVGLKHES